VNRTTHKICGTCVKYSSGLDGTGTGLCMWRLDSIGMIDAIFLPQTLIPKDVLFHTLTTQGSTCEFWDSCPDQTIDVIAYGYHIKAPAGVPPGNIVEETQTH